MYAMVVPGSGLIKAQAENEGLDKIFKEAGFDWREAVSLALFSFLGPTVAHDRSRAGLFDVPGHEP